MSFVIGAIKAFFKDFKNYPLYFKRLNFKSFIVFIKHPFLMRKCMLKLNASFSTKDKNLIIHLNNHKLAFNFEHASSKITVIPEVFYETIYNINTSDNCILIDVGMNIGCTSIYFALKPNIKQIYAFEPFKETYDQAIYNFNLNKKVSKKIIPFNYGLAAKNETMKAYYSISSSGSMTTSPEIFKASGLNASKMEVKNIELRDVCDEFNKIFRKSKGKKRILKIDCEGSEYEIFKALDKKGLFKELDFILLEWHYKGEKPLLDILEKNGFVSFSRNYTSVGLINAVKVKQK